jgi:adenine deaminase
VRKVKVTVPDTSCLRSHRSNATLVIFMASTLIPPGADLAYLLDKAELHVHIEGTLEPELMFALANRNDVALPYPDLASVKAAYSFGNLQDFLDIYYAACNVLRTREDFRDLTLSYLDRVVKDNVRHVELFFDPQTHTGRGIPIGTVIEGISDGLAVGRERHGITSYMIPNFLRHVDADDAMRTLEEALPYRDRIVGWGLDSSEIGNPPAKFADVFRAAQAYGFHTVMHAGEEGPPDYVWQALDLGAERIDHGVRSLEDPRLIARLVGERIPLTVCPLSNVRLRVFDRIEDHNLRRLLELGILATVHSDDPAYFGGYIAANFAAVRAAGLSDRQLVQLARNSFTASFLPPLEKQRHIAAIDDTATRYIRPVPGVD